MATQEETITAQVVLRAVLPVIKVMLQDDPATRKRFKNVNATVQFVAQDSAGPVGAHLYFNNGAVEVVQELLDKPDLQFSFSSLAKMNAMFAGKPVIPRIKGFTKLGLLIKVFGILLGLKILMPTAQPKDPLKARLKVKMTLYMVSTALSVLNKSGDPEMKQWTKKQPERIYQWTVEGEDIACYLKVKAGMSKAGRGVYTRRKPFVHMRFRDVASAQAVLTNSVELVQAMGQGMVENEGSPEYGGQVGDFMFKIAGMLS